MTDRRLDSTLTGLVIARIAFAEVVGTINNSSVAGGADYLINKYNESLLELTKEVAHGESERKED